MMAETVAPGLEQRLKAELTGEVMFDRFTRGRYATDASHYQVMPVGVVAPRTVEEAMRAIAVAKEEGVSVLPRGGGTSQAGQTVNSALVIDCSKHLHKLIDLDVAGRRCAVEPGIVLDDLNRRLKAHGLWFPVDISTASRATIGGMAATIPAARARSATAIRGRTCFRSMPSWPTEPPPISGRLRLIYPTLRTILRSSRSHATSLRSAPAKPEPSRSGFRRCSAGSEATISTR